MKDPKNILKRKHMTLFFQITHKTMQRIIDDAQEMKELEELKNLPKSIKESHRIYKSSSAIYVF